jgi:CubicO group peptidase (beta-lactamase class C family)
MVKPLGPAGLAVCLLSLQCAAAAAQSFPQDSVIQAMIDERVGRVGAVGVVVGVLEADGTIRTFEAGSAGAGRAPLGPLSVFEIGSLTKVFTGTLLADMVRRGEGRLEDPVAKYLPETVIVPARNGSEIRLVDLGTHRSGLPRMPSNFRPADPNNPYADYTPGLLYGFLTQHQLRRDIGAEAEYSNLGVGLLGHALTLRAPARSDPTSRTCCGS